VNNPTARANRHNLAKAKPSRQKLFSAQTWMFQMINLKVLQTNKLQKFQSTRALKKQSAKRFRSWQSTWLNS
jgi:hypothetical protein